MDIQGKVDFTKGIGNINPWLHCAGFCPSFHCRHLRNNDDDIINLKLKATRTHDWALVNPGQRVIDTHFIFPLMKLDPADPTNYYFDATDKLLELTRNAGMEIFYRMGTSIEHTGDAGHFNILIPESYEHYAEVLAGIIRHYNKGWANGYEWNIKYWEIWNEPDGVQNCWGGTGESYEVLYPKFIEFFVVVLKRLKSEFPDIKVGGPALCNFYPEFFDDLFKACKEAGIAPDFISWHHYNSDPEYLIDKPKYVRQFCDERGFKDVELIINEWHYILDWVGIHGIPRFTSADMIERAQLGPTGHNNIESATFILSVLSGWMKDQVLDQAYYYGSGAEGNWGYLDNLGNFYKTYYALKMMGEIVDSCEKMVEVKQNTEKAYLFGAWSKDGKTAYLLVSEYRSITQLLNIEVAGTENPKNIEAVVLDHTRNCLPVDVKYRNGVLTLPKVDTHSSAFLVKFEI